MKYKLEICTEKRKTLTVHNRIEKKSPTIAIPLITYYTTQQIAVYEYTYLIPFLSSFF